MRILYIALLSCGIYLIFASEVGKDLPLMLVVGENSIENTSDARRFREKIMEGDIDTAKYIFERGGKNMKEYCNGYFSIWEVPKLLA